MQSEAHGNIHTIIMMVNASRAVDNTMITCEFGDGVFSENATLLVISGESVKQLIEACMNLLTIAYISSCSSETKKISYFNNSHH